jgi:hypothetical protein
MRARPRPFTRGAGRARWAAAPRAPGRGRARRLPQGGRHVAAARTTMEATATSRRFTQWLGWPADAARLEGGCHAGRGDGELVAAVAPAARHRAPVLSGARRVTRRADGHDGERAARHAAVISLSHPPPARSAVVCGGQRARRASPALVSPPGPPLPRRPHQIRKPQGGTPIPPRAS